MSLQEKYQPILELANQNGTTYNLITYLGTLTGTFGTVQGTPAGAALAYGVPLGGGVNSIQLVMPVPEPAHLLVLCGGAAAAFRVWRRRKAQAAVAA